MQHPGDAMPPVIDFIPSGILSVVHIRSILTRRVEEGDDSDDDDIQVGAPTQDYRCPLTLTLLVNPLTS